MDLTGTFFLAIAADGMTKSSINFREVAWKHVFCCSLEKTQKIGEEVTSWIIQFTCTVTQFWWSKHSKYTQPLLCCRAPSPLSLNHLFPSAMVLIPHTKANYIRSQSTFLSFPLNATIKPLSYKFLTMIGTNYILHTTSHVTRVTFRWVNI